MSYNRSNSSYSCVSITFIFSLLGILICIALVIGVQLINSLDLNTIDHDEARTRFAEQLDVDVSEVKIIRHSNSTILGDPWDVTYELDVNGEYLTGECFSSEFSEMVCKIYDTNLE